MKKVNCILLIDDNEADNEFHKRAIAKAGVCDRVEVAERAMRALEYLKECGANNTPPPDVIFLDINMPGMNGFEFLEEYNGLPPALKSKMVVFMLTSSLMPSDRQKADNSGEVSEFLRKPLTPETVTQLVEKYF